MHPKGLLALVLKRSQTERSRYARQYVIAVAIVLVCVGAKLTFLAAPIAEADSRSIAGASVDVSRMQQNIENLQVQEVHDMTFVFPSPALMI